MLYTTVKTFPKHKKTPLSANRCQLAAVRNFYELPPGVLNSCGIRMAPMLLGVSRLLFPGYAPVYRLTRPLTHAPIVLQPPGHVLHPFEYASFGSCPGRFAPPQVMFCTLFEYAPIGSCPGCFATPRSCFAPFSSTRPLAHAPVVLHPFRVRPPRDYSLLPVIVAQLWGSRSKQCIIYARIMLFANGFLRLLRERRGRKSVSRR